MKKDIEKLIDNLKNEKIIRKKKRLFVDLCRILINGLVENKFDSFIVARYIVSAGMFNELVDDPKLNEIIELAGNLELPIEHQIGDNEENWVRLRKLIGKM